MDSFKKSFATCLNTVNAIQAFSLIVKSWHNVPGGRIYIKLLSTQCLSLSACTTVDRLQIFDIMGYEPSHWNKINIHVGGQYGSKQETILRFAENFKRLSAACQARLTGTAMIANFHCTLASCFTQCDLTTLLSPALSVLYFLIFLMQWKTVTLLLRIVWKTCLSFTG